MVTIVESVRAAARWAVARARLRSERGSTVVEHAIVVSVFAIMTVGALALLVALAAPEACQESWDRITPNC